MDTRRPTIFTPIPLVDALPQAVDLDWLSLRERSLQADFSFGRDDPRRLRVSFSIVAVVRTLDDKHWSTEQEEPCYGIAQDHFAYTVEGARFWKAQSVLITEQAGRTPHLQHYAFLTGWTCLDVISNQPPLFTLLL